MISSTAVPPTGRSSASANFFSGLQLLNRFSGGSLLIGTSLATGMFRSRIKIEPYLRAFRTQASVRRCSSRIEISFMCDMVTHESPARQSIERGLKPRSCELIDDGRSPLLGEGGDFSARSAIFSQLP